MRDRRTRDHRGPSPGGSRAAGCGAARRRRRGRRGGGVAGPGAAGSGPSLGRSASSACSRRRSSSGGSSGAAAASTSASAAAAGTAYADADAGPDRSATPPHPRRRDPARRRGDRPRPVRARRPRPVRARASRSRPCSASSGSRASSSSRPTRGRSGRSRRRSRRSSGRCRRRTATRTAAATALREALAERHGVGFDEVVVAAGADAVIGYVCQAMLDPGDEVVTPWPSFPSYVLDPLKRAAVPVRVDLDDGRVDVDALLAAVTERTKLAFLPTVEQPDGDRDHRRRSCGGSSTGVPEHVLTVVDEAYFEYVDDPVVPRRDRGGRPGGRPRARAADVLEDLRPRRAADRLRRRAGAP